MNLDKLKALRGPVTWIAIALIMIFFWAPLWSFVIEIATKAKDLLPNR